MTNYQKECAVAEAENELIISAAHKWYALILKVAAEQEAEALKQEVEAK